MPSQAMSRAQQVKRVEPYIVCRRARHNKPHSCAAGTQIKIYLVHLTFSLPSVRKLLQEMNGAWFKIARSAVAAPLHLFVRMSPQPSNLRLNEVKPNVLLELLEHVGSG